MEKKIAGLIGAVASLGALGTAQATPAPADVLNARSYAELLEPISDAGAKLQALDAAAAGSPQGETKVAQIYFGIGHHHHHHHHHGYYRRGPRVIVVPRDRGYYWRHHHHHHHHHHHGYWRGDW